MTSGRSSGWPQPAWGLQRPHQQSPRPLPHPLPPSTRQGSSDVPTRATKGREEGSSPCGQPGGPKLRISFKSSVSLNMDANFNPLHNQYVVEYINTYEYFLTYLKLEPWKNSAPPSPLAPHWHNRALPDATVLGVAPGICPSGALRPGLPAPLPVKRLGLGALLPRRPRAAC